MVPMKLTIQTARPYSVILENGLLDRVGEMALQTRKPGSQAMLISETNVYPLYGERVKASLEKAGFAVSTFVFPAGEASKQLSTVLEMYSALARQGFTRTDFIVTLGGGVTGDMGGFAAATFLRGMPFLQVPTTLLSQVDASVGGKTGVDLPVGKNLVGAFHQPEAVLTDPETLATLPERFSGTAWGRSSSTAASPISPCWRPWRLAPPWRTWSSCWPGAWPARSPLWRRTPGTPAAG